MISAEVFGQQVHGFEFLVGEKDEVTETYGHPVLLLIFQGGIFLGMFEHIIALPLKSVMLIYINVGKDLLAKQFNFLPP